MKYNDGRGWPWLVLACLLLSGCPKRGFYLPPSQRIQDPAALLAELRASGDRLQSLRMEGTIALRQGSKRIKARMTAVGKRPSFLRFETESFFDTPLSILVTDGMNFSLWDMDQGRFFVGPATPNNISRVLPLQMDGPEVVGVLLGDPPLIAYAQSSLQFDEAKGLYHLTLSNSRQRQELLIHPATLRPENVTCHELDQLLYNIAFEDWDNESGNVSVPKKIVFELPTKDVLLTLRVRAFHSNPSLEDILFTITPPAGTSVEPVE
jgi:hypothetical protein